MRISEFERDGYTNIAAMGTMQKSDSEYIKDAYDFCKRYNVRVWLREVDSRPDANGVGNFANSSSRRHFHFVISRDGKQYRGYYTGSIRREFPSCYDLLACITKDDPGDMGDFVQEFGYTITDHKSFHYVESIWKACWKEYKAMRRLFGDNETVWDELCEIA